MLNPQRSLSELPRTSTASQVERGVLVSCSASVAAPLLDSRTAGGASHCYCTELPTVAVSPEPARALLL